MEQVILSKTLGDMEAVYILDTDTENVGLSLLPIEKMKKYDKKMKCRPLAELKIVGDNYSGSYFGGTSMKYSDSTLSMKYTAQEIKENESNTEIITHLKNSDNIEITHILTYAKNRKYITVKTEITNNSEKDIRLEMLSSFAMCGISPYLEGAGEEKMKLHRIRSRWSEEGRLVTESLEDLMLEDCWCYANSHSVRFGQVGSMPTKGYFPFMAIEDTENNVIWGVQMGCPSSWQMEVTRSDDGVCISGGLADREFGHWMKTLHGGENFSGPEAVISVCRGDTDDISARLLEAQEDSLSVPESEETLPIIFNEYCTTWGCPSHENISDILDALSGKDVDYFVIDCGWFKEDGVRWDISMGDYLPSKTLFPNGIDETAELIKSHNMLPGIWFEIENVGSESNAYKNEEHLLKRDGITLTTQNRRFWDMNDEWVIKYLDERVIGFLKEHGFGYIKVDYNETIGIGCDNSDSLGEGLRQNMFASLDYFKKMREEIPDLVIENCASGGNRLEPCFMSHSSMASFSDAHECVEIPIIAANLHRVILPRKSQIWCVIRQNDSLKRIAYSVSATFLGRMCLSGDITSLTDEQWQMIDNGIAFYKKAASVIKNGVTRHILSRDNSERHPEGAQVVMRERGDTKLITVHTFKNAPQSIKLPISDTDEIISLYSHTDNFITNENGEYTIKNSEDFSGYGILVKKP